MSLAADVAAALDRVVDPCSLQARAPQSLVDMGLVDWSVDPTGAVALRMWVTSPCCVYGPRLAEAAGRELRAVAGVTDVQVTFDHTVLWSPAMMTAAGRASLAARRAASAAAADVRPHRWEPAAP